MTELGFLGSVIVLTSATPTLLGFVILVVALGGGKNQQVSITVDYGDKNETEPFHYAARNPIAIGIIVRFVSGAVGGSEEVQHATIGEVEVTPILRDVDETATATRQIRMDLFSSLIGINSSVVDRGKLLTSAVDERVA